MIQELEKKTECLQKEIERIREEDSQLLPTKKMIDSIQEQKQKLLNNYYESLGQGVSFQTSSKIQSKGLGGCIV